MMGRWWIRLFLDGGYVNLSTISERKVETIDNSEPTFDERSITGNRVVNMNYLQLLFIC